MPGTGRSKCCIQLGFERLLRTIKTVSSVEKQRFSKKIKYVAGSTVGLVCNNRQDWRNRKLSNAR